MQGSSNPMRAPFVRLALLALSFLAAPSFAASDRADSEKAVHNLLACRGVADATARLACFDREIDGLAPPAKGQQTAAASAPAAKPDAQRSALDLATQDDIRGKAARRPQVNADGTPAPKTFDAKIVSVSVTKNDRWRFALSDGTAWETSEPSNSVRPNVNGTVRLQRAAFGSYFATFDGGRSLRCHRVK